MIYQTLYLRFSRLTFHTDSILANGKKLNQQNILSQAILQSINLYYECNEGRGIVEQKYTLFILKLHFTSNTRLKFDCVFLWNSGSITAIVKLNKQKESSKWNVLLWRILKGRFAKLSFKWIKFLKLVWHLKKRGQRYIFFLYIPFYKKKILLINCCGCNLTQGQSIVTFIKMGGWEIH